MERWAQRQQDKGTFAYFIDYNLTRRPPLNELTLLAPSGALGGLQFLRSGSLVGMEFSALLSVSMLLLAVGTFLAGLRVGQSGLSGRLWHGGWFQCGK